MSDTKQDQDNAPQAEGDSVQRMLAEWTHGKLEGSRARRHTSGRVEVFVPQTIEGDYHWEHCPHYPQRFKAFS